MSLFNKLQKAFGFSYDDETQESVINGTSMAAVISADAEKSLSSQPSPMLDNRSANPMPGNDNQDDASVIFKGVIDVLNRELPPFLKNNLNERGQQQYLYNALDQSLKEYLAAITDAQKQKMFKIREQERDKLHKSLDELKEKLKNAEEQLSQQKEKTLSMERQKRAIAMRVNDLEARKAALEAEKEQYDLENRSLLNKLRVAEVTAQMGSPENAEKLNSQIEQQQKRISELSDDNKRLTEELAQIRQSFAQQSEKNSRVQEEINSLKKDKESAEKIAQSLRSEISELKAKYEDLLAAEAEKLNQKNQSRDSGIYEVISFDRTAQGNVESAKEPQGENPDNAVTKPEEPDSVEIPRTVEKKAPVKTEKKKKKTARQEKDDFLNDTDWLVDIEEPENLDRVVTSENNETTKSNDNNYPSQMSLW